MLKQFRSRRLMKRVMLVTLVLIIPSFVAFYGWSTGSGRGGGGETTGDWFARFKVPGWLGKSWEKITSQKELEAAKRELEQRASEALREQGNASLDANTRRRLMREYAESTRRIATEAVNLRLIQKEAKRAQVAVSDDELMLAHQSMITQIRRQNQDFADRSDREIGQWLERYEPNYRSNLLNDRVRRDATDARRNEALLSLQDIWNSFRALHEKIEADWAQFRVLDYLKEVSPTTPTLQEYFEAHKTDYAFPDQREYTHVLVRRADIAKDVTVTTEAVRKYYEQRPDEFTEPASVHARLIQLNMPSGDTATTASMAELEDAVKEIGTALKDPKADFAALADKYSEEPANKGAAAKDKKNGGLMESPISEKNPSLYGPEFDKAALSLADKETTGPIVTQQALFFIQSDKTTPARIRAFSEALADVEQAAMQRAVDAKVEETRARFKTESDRQTTMEALAREMGAKLGGPVIMEKGSVAIPNVAELTGEEDTLKDLKKGDRTPVLATQDFLIVMELMSEIPAHPATFDEVAGRVASDVKSLQAAEKAKAAADKFASLVRAPDADFFKAAKQMGVESATTASFTRSQPPFGGFIEHFDVKTADVTTDTIRVDTVTARFAKIGAERKPMSYVVWKVLKLEGPSKEEFLKRSAYLMTYLAERPGEILVREWLADQRRAAQFELSPLAR